jgi:hypothetical protein
VRSATGDISTSGVERPEARSRAIRSSSFGKLVPEASARWEAAWMTGPSAMGSENGTPSSMMSAPALAMAGTRRSVAASDGSPAHR